jgi:fibronectin type 3 domain-containing protein
LPFANDLFLLIFEFAAKIYFYFTEKFQEKHLKALIPTTLFYCTRMLTIPFRFFRQFLAGVLCFLLVFAAISCGKRRPPVPPAQSPVLNSIAAIQQGNQIVLKIVRPATQSQIKQVNIYRLSEVAGSSLFLSEDDFASRSTLVAAVDEPYKSNAKEVLYTDALSNLAQSARLRYAVRYIYDDGRQSAFSSFAIIEPTAQVASAPASLNAEVTQEAVLLKWQAPTTNITQSQNVNVIGYNIYRAESTGEAVKLNQTPSKNADFADSRFEFGKQYQYFVRAVTLGANGAPLESLNSNVVAVNPVDIFAPSAPQGLTIAAAPGRLSLFFAANSETDVAGYNIYRSTDENTPPSAWQKMNQILVKATTFQDERVESGVKYFYYITAVDNAFNTSAPSEIVSETAP